MGQPIIGVIGPGEGATLEEMNLAYALGQTIAQRGWVTLSGGRNCGVMDAVCRGAKSAAGLTVGILPRKDKCGASDALDIAIPTGIGSARNNINVLASDVLISCGMGLGTASEIALAIKAHKPVVLIKASPEAEAFFSSFDTAQVVLASTLDEAIAQVEQLLSNLISSPQS